MPTSKLDPYAADLMQRSRQGYTLRMLQLHLHAEKNCHISQASISRWLSRLGASQQSQLEPDAEYHRYQALAKLGSFPRPYRRRLTRWLGHIRHLRNHGATLPDIQAELKRRGVEISIRSLQRALAAR